MKTTTCTECLNDATARNVVRAEAVHTAACGLLASLVAGPVVGVGVGGLLTCVLEWIGTPTDSAVTIGMAVWSAIAFGLPGFCAGRLWTLWTDRE